MTRQQAEAQAAQDQGGQGFLHLVGLHRECDDLPEKALRDIYAFPEPEGDFGGDFHIDCASI